MIGIIDYGAGNLKSVANALDRLAKNYRICSRREHLAQVARVVLPGVGQFAAAARHLRRAGLFETLQAWGREGNPIVGICLGLELLFESSEEAPGQQGLALLPGRIVKLTGGRVPHMGWSRIRPRRGANWLLPEDGEHFYFAHSYVAEPESTECVAATVEIEGRAVPAGFQCGAIRAVQFHPEKSAGAGARLLDRMLTC